MGDNLNLGFSDTEYNKYLRSRDHISNERLRPENQSFFEALASDKGDMTKTEEGKLLISALQSLHD